MTGCSVAGNLGCGYGHVPGAILFGGAFGVRPSPLNLEGWWRLDDTGDPATWKDSQNDQFPLTKSGTVTSVAVGHVGGSAAFTVAGSGHLLNSSFSDIFHKFDFTVGGWWKIDDATTNPTMISQYGGTLGVQHWRVYRGGSPFLLNFLIKNNAGTNFIAQSDVGFPGAQPWVFIVGVRQANLMTLYIDGLPQATTATVSGTLNQQPQPLWIGRGQSTYANQEVDEAFIWTKALTPQNILWLWNGGAGRTHNELYPGALLDTNDNVLFDTSGNALYPT